MRNPWISCIVATVALAPALAGAADLKRRTFLFVYGGAVTGLKAGEAARVWLPVARTNGDQDVEVVDQIVPGQVSVTFDERGENELLFFRATAGDDGVIPFSVAYRVTRHEVAEATSASWANDSRYLRTDALVPVGGKPARVMLAGKAMPPGEFERGRVLYDLVDDYMRYGKDKPGWGRGDAEWACESGFGNCTDFHSLFISLSRFLNIPAKFEMGFAIPAGQGGRGTGDVPGYHCWAKFKPAGHGWVPVDISEAKKDPTRREYYFGRLDENRMMFSSGRDLQLVPRQAGPPVNYLVYPYIEVNGKPYPQEKIRREFTYRDLEPVSIRVK
jgi:transglutaminase-like putative cysteine protease